MQNKIKFSRKTISIVALVFALIGAFFLWRTFAADPVVIMLQAENMQNKPYGSSVVRDSSASYGKSLKFTQNNTSASSLVTVTSPMETVTIRARSTSCNGWANVNVAIDDKTVIPTTSVQTTRWKNYTKNITLAKGDHTIKVTATNLGKSSRCSRQFYADVITLQGPAAVATPAPTIAFSASQVTAGSASTLTWTSTNATSCTANGAWSGAKATSGSVSTGVLNANTTYGLSCTGPGGTTTASATAVVTAAPTNPNPPTGGTGSGNGTLLLDATFDSNLTNYPTKYFRAGALTFLNPRQEKFYVTTADSLAGNEGHYRADILTKDIYKPGVPTCTTVTVQFPEGLATVPRNSWLQFAEAKTPRVDYQGWNMGVSSWYNGGANSFTIGFQGFAGNGTNPGSPAWVSPPMDNAIHNFSVCTNNAADNTGTIESIWMDGVRQTFNQGAAKGKQSLSGFPIIKDAAAYPLVINSYTGGSPVPVTSIHGAPLIATIGSDGKPPMPPGGWRTF